MDIRGNITGKRTRYGTHISTCKRTLLYSGASYIRTPEIWILQLTDGFIWKHIFILYFVQYIGNFVFLTQTACFYNKNGLTINVASFNGTVDFNGTRIYTIERLRLLPECHTFLPASPNEYMV